MRSPKRSRSARALGPPLAFAMAIGSVAGPAAAKDDLLGKDFESFTGIPKSAAHEVAENELGGYRGMAGGDIFFQVVFTGLVDLGSGRTIASLGVNAALGGQSDSITLPGSPAMNVAGNGGGGATVTNTATGDSTLIQSQAAIGGNAFQGANGFFLIGQSPGTNTIQDLHLTVNIGFITPTPAQFANLQNFIATLGH